MRRPRFTSGYEAAFGLIEDFLAVMETKNITKAELARRTGVKPPSVSKWFSPGRNLTVFTAAMIAEALGTHLRFKLTDQEATAKARREDLFRRLTRLREQLELFTTEDRPTERLFPVRERQPETLAA